MRSGRLQIVALAIGLLVGCAAAQAGPRVVADKGVSFQQNEALRQAFQRYWGFRAKGDFLDAFKMEAPYIQEMVSPDTYHDYIRLFSKVQLDEIHIYRMDSEEPFFVSLECRGVYQQKGKPETRDFLDHWVRADGKWYHVIKNPLMFPQL
jgi:hypothetical protein